VKDGAVIKDVGIIVRCYHPAVNKNILILAGAYSYATVAAARYVTNESLLKRSSSILKNRNYVIVISTDVVGTDVTNIKKIVEESF
jgi:hypothetical protein